MTKILNVNTLGARFSGLHKILERERPDYDIITVRSKKQALHEYPKHNSIDLIIIGTNLGGTVRGWHLYDSLRDVGYEGPVLATTYGTRPRPKWEERSVPYICSQASNKIILRKIDSIIKPILPE